MTKFHSVPVGVAMSRRFNVQVQGQPRFQPQSLNISMSQSLGTPKTDRAVGQGCKCPATGCPKCMSDQSVGFPHVSECQRLSQSVGFPHVSDFLDVPECRISLSSQAPGGEAQRPSVCSRSYARRHHRHLSASQRPGVRIMNAKARSCNVRS